MNVLAIIELLTSLSGMYGQISGLVEGAMTAMSETDQAKLKAKLAELRASNDAAFSRLDAKLADAAG